MPQVTKETKIPSASISALGIGETLPLWKDPHVCSRLTIVAGHLLSIRDSLAEVVEDLQVYRGSFSSD